MCVITWGNMRFQNKKILKILDELKITVARFDLNGKRYCAQGKRNYMEWWVEDDGTVQQVCVHTIGQHDDIQSDYFCGRFPKTYKRIKEEMGE